MELERREVEKFDLCFLNVIYEPSYINSEFWKNFSFTLLLLCSLFYLNLLNAWTFKNYLIYV